MSPGATMQRVYIELKARVLAGTFPPGSRLEPAQLATSLGASATPVRDALHRLAGERLIESWHQEGFRQPILAEADLCDLYSWAAMLLALALKDRPAHQAAGGLFELEERPSYGEATESLFRTIAMSADNRELRGALINAIERSQILRRAEVRVDQASRGLLAAMEEDYRFGRWTGLRSKITSFHRRRVRQAGRIVAELRPRTDPLR